MENFVVKLGIGLFFYVGLVSFITVLLTIGGPHRKDLCSKPETYIGYTKKLVRPACWLSAKFEEK